MECPWHIWGNIFEEAQNAKCDTKGLRAEVAQNCQPATMCVDGMPLMRIIGLVMTNPPITPLAARQSQQVGRRKVPGRFASKAHSTPLVPEAAEPKALSEGDGGQGNPIPA